VGNAAGKYCNLLPLYPTTLSNELAMMLSTRTEGDMLIFNVANNLSIAVDVGSLSAFIAAILILRRLF
jgi:hypothetical protein